MQKITLKFASLAFNKLGSPRITLLRCTKSAQAFRVYYFAVWFGIRFCLIGLGFVAAVVFKICIYVSLKCQKYTSTLKSSKTTATKSQFLHNQKCKE